MEKYGFVYIWRDKKHHRYYIGSHWGREDDGYLCSSNWMRDAYKRRPKDFKRRILSRIYTNRLDMFQKEQEWINLIKPEEIKIRYYNLHLTVGHWTQYPEKIKTISEKISHSLSLQPKRIGELNPFFGKTHSEETKTKIKEKRAFQITSEKTKAKMRQSNHPPSRKGIKHSPETIEKMKSSRVGEKNAFYGRKHSEETKEKIKQTKLNKYSKSI